ncbi:hypothetical protein L1887_60484 [Cichorium endivia]|nr:hypothetical protein L1887_60484 [Cichorium endivia]
MPGSARHVFSQCLKCTLSEHGFSFDTGVRAPFAVVGIFKRPNPDLAIFWTYCEDPINRTQASCIDASAEAHSTTCQRPCGMASSSIEGVCIADSQGGLITLAPHAPRTRPARPKQVGLMTDACASTALSEHQVRREL